MMFLFRCFLFGLLGAIVIASQPTECLAIQIRAKRWGFDGKVVVDQHNVLSILVDNPSDVNVDVRLRIENQWGGLPLEEGVFLGPFQRRWVQFFPWVSNSSGAWTIQWVDEKNRRQKEEINDGGLPIPQGTGAHVKLEPEDAIAQNWSKWQLFPDELFPASVTGTNTLKEVLIDYVPRWETARRKALLEWIHCGGTLLVVPTAAGAYPEFPADLAMLNLELDEQRIGQGRVKRISREQAIARGEEVRRTVDSGNRNYLYNYATLVPQMLRQITKVTHNWGMIHLLSVTYLFLIFPGWFLLARQRVGYMTTLCAFVGLVALFVAMFNYLGRRGSGESTQVNSFAWARPVGQGVFYVTEWANVFVTGGDYYKLTYPGEGHQFALAQTNESTMVDGVIDGGAQGAMTIDIPLFSSRTYRHTARYEGPAIAIESHDAEMQDGVLQNLVCNVSGLPDKASIQGIALYGDRVYQLRADPGSHQLKQVGSDNMPVSSYVQSFNQGYYGVYDESLPGQDDQLRQLLPVFVAESLEMHRRASSVVEGPPDGELRLFVVSNAPAAWQLTSPGFSLQRQLVAYELVTQLEQEG